MTYSLVVVVVVMIMQQEYRQLGSEEMSAAGERVCVCVRTKWGVHEAILHQSQTSWLACWPTTTSSLTMVAGDYMNLAAGH